MMLYKLLAHGVLSVDQANVVSLTDVGPVGARIRELGISVSELLGLQN